MTAETSTPAVEQTALSPADRALLRTVFALARADGLVVRRDRAYYTSDSGIHRWRAVRQGCASVTVECWLYEEPDERWKLWVASGCVQVAIRRRLTLRQAVDACVFAGILPNGLSSAAGAGWSAGCIAVASHADAMASLGDGDDPEREAGWRDGCEAVAGAARRLAGTPGVAQ